MARITACPAGKDFWTLNFQQVIEVNVDSFTSKIEESGIIVPSETGVRSIIRYTLLGIPTKPTVSQDEFNLFLRRFGPFHRCLEKSAQSFFNGAELQPWFHGSISRSQAEEIVLAGSPGTFLVRFSEHHPTKFTLCYQKADGQLRNSLLHNLPDAGVGVEEGGGRFRHYAGVADFVARNGRALSRPCPSRLAAESARRRRAHGGPAAAAGWDGDGAAKSSANRNRYVSGQRSYAAGGRGGGARFDASAYAPAGFGAAAAAHAQPPAGAPWASGGGYAPAGFGFSGPGGSDPSSIGAGGQGLGGGLGAYGPAGFGALAGGPALGNYGPAGFAAAAPSEGGFGAASAAPGGGSGGGGLGAYGPAGFGFDLPDEHFQDPAGPASTPTFSARLSLDSELPETAPGMGAYRPAFLPAAPRPPPPKAAPALDDLPPPPPIGFLKMERNSSRGLGVSAGSAGSSVRSTDSAASLKEKFDRARQLSCAPPPSPPRPAGAGEGEGGGGGTGAAEALGLLEEVAGLAAGCGDWPRQRLRCEAMLLRGQLLVATAGEEGRAADPKAGGGGSEGAVEALESCLDYVDEVEDLQCPARRRPPTAEEAAAQAAVHNRLRALRFSAHGQLAAVHGRAGAPARALAHFEELVGCAEDEAARKACRAAALAALGEGGEEGGGGRFTEEEARGHLARAAAAFKARDLPAAAAAFRQALGVARLGNLPEIEARAMGNLATVNKQQQHLTIAIRQYKESIKLFRRLGTLESQEMVRKMLNFITLCCIEAERHACAKMYCTELLSISMKKENIYTLRQRLEKIDQLMSCS